MLNFINNATAIDEIPDTYNALDHATVLDVLATFAPDLSAAIADYCTMATALGYAEIANAYTQPVLNWAQKDGIIGLAFAQQALILAVRAKAVFDLDYAPQDVCGTIAWCYSLNAPIDREILLAWNGELTHEYED